MFSTVIASSDFSAVAQWETKLLYILELVLPDCVRSPQNNLRPLSVAGMT